MSATLIQPIGVFDSGVGGLSILQEIQHQFPNENLVYVGDIHHAPYGTKSLEFIFERAIKICDFLLAQNVKAIVVACNTATVSVVKLLRERYSLPIIGVEPAVKPAALNSKTGQVGVLATERTLQSRSFNQLMSQFEPRARFHKVAANGLVEKIEQADLTSQSTKAMVHAFLGPMLENNIDALVLGCTHYPFIKPLLTQLLPEHVAIYDTAAPVTKELGRRLEAKSLLAPENLVGTTLFYTSAQESSAKTIISRLLGQAVDVQAF